MTISPRNHRPVILLHGALVGHEDMVRQADHAQAQGHSVDLRTYPTIRDGARLEESARLVADNINSARLAVARQNVEKLKAANQEDLRKHFRLRDDLYGEKDPRVAPLLAALPQVVAETEGLLGSPSNLGVRTQELERRLEGKLAEIDPQAARKLAAEIVDSLVPQAIVIGHSAGGFVGYMLAVQSERYDGGRGIGEVVLLSSPVEGGMPAPLPPALADMPFYQLEKRVLRPLEPLLQLNPFYPMSKSLAKAGYAVATQLSTALTSPFIYAARPGFGQVMEGSEVVKAVASLPIPADTSVLAVTSPLDGMALEERSQVDESGGNGHNLSLDLKLAPGELERERPTWTHVKIAQLPEEIDRQLADRMLADPTALARVLAPVNDDGMRCRVLAGLAGRELSAKSRAILRQVALERSPFEDSPAYLAQQLLESEGAGLP